LSDNTSQIQAALDAPGEVHLPAGKYFISKEIYSRIQGRVIRGDGIRSTWIVLTKPNQKGIVMEAAGSIRDLTIDSLVEGTTGIFVNAPLTKAQGPRFRDIEILNQEIGLHLVGWVDLVADGLIISGPDQIFGILIDNYLNQDLTAGVITNSVFTDPGRDSGKAVFAIYQTNAGGL